MAAVSQRNPHPRVLGEESLIFFMEESCLQQNGECHILSGVEHTHQLRANTSWWLPSSSPPSAWALRGEKTDSFKTTREQWTCVRVQTLARSSSLRAAYMESCMCVNTWVHVREKQVANMVICHTLSFSVDNTTSIKNTIAPGLCMCLDVYEAHRNVLQGLEGKNHYWHALFFLPNNNKQSLI